FLHSSVEKVGGIWHALGQKTSASLVHILGKEIFSFISVLAFALLWLFLWRKFGIPVVAVQLAFLLSGLLVASILFYSQLGDIYIFANDATFWTCFVCLLIVTQKPFGCLTSLFYIIALSLVGSYAVIFAVNYYVGGNLPYILLNTYRRITVANFGSAVIAPPYQTMGKTCALLLIC
uniref:TM7S3/TM198-like domain-containing protein n=1 Tax=Dendroctonus ponderosae TaxID=77166 RepID=A0AAR5PKL0_DENPD